tara:strand:+ start:3735 stop:4889 length:1155 start_codon:yes stop_codon:yes gene_type:complete
MYKKKNKVLRIISSINPKFGGPSKTIIDSSILLTTQGFKVDILTSDPVYSNFFKSRNIKIINKGPALGNYSFNFSLFFWLLKNKKNYDHFIVHGIWEFNTLIARLLLKNKYFVFTHGQLDPYFMSEKLKKFKKQIYWFFVEKQNLLCSKSLLLTSENEKNLLKNTFVNTKDIKKKIIGYGIIKPSYNKIAAKKDFYKKFPKLKGKKFLLYLGRFHEKKGCEILLKALKKLSDENIKFNILIAGPDNDYKKKLIELSKNYNLTKQIHWSGMLLKNLKWGAISLSKAMVLASHGENFGVSIVESLSCSKPVLTTNKVNIYKKIIKYKSGYISKDNVNSFFSILKKFNNLNKKQLIKLSKNSLKCFNDNFNLETNKKSLANFLNNAK